MTSEGCSCHLHPPCAFCESLNEAEAEAFLNGGADAVWRLRDQEKREIAADDERKRRREERD